MLEKVSRLLGPTPMSDLFKDKPDSLQFAL